MTQNIQTICVYCGASQNVSDVYRHAIEDLAQRLVAAGKTIVYGGGSVGTMGYLAKAAMDAGGEVIGIIPEHIISTEGQLHEVSELHVVDSMHSRKRLMVEKSDAFISMPGGMGTLDETFEILTWKYLGLHEKPVVIGNINGYWTPMLDMIGHMIGEGYTPKHHMDLFDTAKSVDEIVSIIESYDIEGHTAVNSEKL
jgi:uncharacterized protein (TIGR00730 family)